MTPHQILTAAPVLPVITLTDLAAAADLARALVSGGIRTLEITLRTPAALDALALIRREVPQAVVGAGTVISSALLREAADAGAQFAISPGLHESLARAAAEASIPLIPGVATAGEVQLALEYGLDTLKLFPAEAIGGRALLRALHGPFPQVRFCPTGGITPQSAPKYLALPNVLCVGGSWLAPAAAQQRRDWAAVTRLAKEAAALAAA